MATNINLIPKAASNLLSGKLQSAINASANYFVGDVLPSASKLPTYLWIDFGTSSAELVKVYDVSGSNVYVKRGINNNNTGFSHNQNASYYEAITIEHWNTMVDVLQSGWVLDHTDVYTFTRISATSFKIANVNRTNYYYQDVLVRFNGSSTARVVSSSYASGDTTVNVDASVVPTTISSVELFAPLYFGKEHNEDGTHSSLIVKTTASQTLTNKTLISPRIGTSINDTNGNEIIETPATASAVNQIRIKNATAGNSPEIEASGDDANIDLSLSPKGAGSVKIAGLAFKNKGVEFIHDNGNITGSVSINWANGLRQKAVLTGNVTLDFTNPTEGRILELFLIQDGTGGRNISFTPTINWQDATTPTWTTTAGKINVLTLRYINGSYYGIGAKFA